VPKNKRERSRIRPEEAHPLDDCASSVDRASRIVLIGSAQALFFAPSLAASGLTKFAKSDQEIKQFFLDMPAPVLRDMALKLTVFAGNLIVDYAQDTGQLPSEEQN
jgi:hypothetical protein